MVWSCVIRAGVIQEAILADEVAERCQNDPNQKDRVLAASNAIRVLRAEPHDRRKSIQLLSVSAEGEDAAPGGSTRAD